MNQGQGTEPVGTFEALLRIRQDMHRGLLFLHFGDALVERLAGFIEGYHACMRENGLPDDNYSRFREWLERTKQQKPMEESPTAHLQKSLGDHARAIGGYLALADEFATLRLAQNETGSLSSQSPRKSGRTGPYDTLQYLLQIHQDLGRGRLRAHIGETDAERFNALVDGYNACMDAHRLANERYVRFRDWLRDVKQALPGEGWPAKYMRDCGGDHEQAIRQYLDFAAEFVALPGMSPGQVHE